MSIDLGFFELQGQEGLLRPLVADDAAELDRASAESQANYGMSGVPVGLRACERSI